MNHIMFYFLLALTAVLAATANAGRPVLDLDGNVISNGSYYARPLFEGGGLTLSSRNDEKCPLYIQQDTYDLGIPIRFSNWRSGAESVPESENLNIEMDIKATDCGQSNYWCVGKHPDDIWRFIAVGPKQSGEDSSKSFFQIKKNEIADGYQIVFCPNKDKDCLFVGAIVDETNVQRLALSAPVPYVVGFMKATETTSSKTMSII